MIEKTGRCTGDEVENIEADCTRRYELVVLPHKTGVILKSMDGTQPLVVTVQPATFDSREYSCVKIDGYCVPFAAEQTGGPYSGSTILRYVIRYQQVGGVV